MKAKQRLELIREGMTKYGLKESLARCIVDNIIEREFDQDNVEQIRTKARRDFRSEMEG